MHAAAGDVRFASNHRAHCEVMLRPDLYRPDDPDLITARDASFDVLYRAVQDGLPPEQIGELLPTSVAAWSALHGFATLFLYGNLEPRLGSIEPLEAFLVDVAHGMVVLGEIISRLPGTGHGPRRAFRYHPTGRGCRCGERDAP